MTEAHAGSAIQKKCWTRRAEGVGGGISFGRFDRIVWCFVWRRCASESQEPAGRTQRGKHDEQGRPNDALSDDAQVGFDHEWIAHQRGERADIRQRVEPIGRDAGVGPGEPHLH